MNNIVKISLTIQLEGSTLVRKSEPEVIKFTITERDLNPSHPWKKNEGNRVVRRGRIKNYPLIAKPASQHINLSVDAYNYMTSSECPYWQKPKVWAGLSPKERLEAHLQRLCEHHGGKSFSYVVLED